MKLGKWLTLDGGGATPSGKTKIWNVLSDDGVALGVIRWFGRWRQYAFYPASNTVYERQCLRDLADFCEQQTRKHASRRGT